MKSHTKTATLLFSLSCMMFSSPVVANNGIQIETPYVRAIPPGQTVSAAFMVLNNETDKDRALVSVSSEIAKRVELHQHLHKDGMMQMRQVEDIKVAAKDKTALMPGGYHVMLIGLNKPIIPEDVVTISLKFDDGSSKEIKAPVKRIEDSMSM